MPTHPSHRARSLAASLALAAPLPDLSLLLLPSPPDAETLALATPAPEATAPPEAVPVPESAARVARALHVDPSAVAGLAVGAGALWAMGTDVPPRAAGATWVPNAVGFAVGTSGALGTLATVWLPPADRLVADVRAFVVVGPGGAGFVVAARF
jgi:hypothetical protein